MDTEEHKKQRILEYVGNLRPEETIDGIISKRLEAVVLVYGPDSPTTLLLDKFFEIWGENGKESELLNENKILTVLTGLKAVFETGDWDTKWAKAMEND